MQMPEREVQQLSISGMAGGAAEELFQDALAKVLENIQDLNTDPKEKRAITLQFVFGCDEERRAGAIDVRCTTKLSPASASAWGSTSGSMRASWWPWRPPGRQRCLPRQQPSRDWCGRRRLERRHDHGWDVRH